MSAPRSLVVPALLASGCLFADPGPGAIEPETGASSEGVSTGGPVPTTTTTTAETATTEVSSTEPMTPTTGEVIEPCSWEQRAPMMAPPGRVDATLTLDEKTGRLVLFGGRVGLTGADLGDTWEFDGEAWHPAMGMGPGPRRGHAAAWDGDRKRVVVFGGEYGGFDVKLATGTWLRDGDKWSERGGDEDEDEEGAWPSLRAYAAMADLPARKQVVMFGGRTASGISDETWMWDGNRWKRALPGLAPSPRFDHTMALDEVSGLVVLHGGCAGALCSEALTDTWVYDGAQWTLLADGPTPGPRGGCMAHDRSEPAMLRFAEGEGYRWSGEAWASAGAAPQALAGFALAYHPGSMGLVLFGGLTAKLVETDDTWLIRCER